MSAVAPGDAAAEPQYGALPCPRCGEMLAYDQDWCLRCGDPARTVIAPTPRWRRPLLAIGALAIVALGVLTAAFISLTDDDPPPPRTITNTITTQPGDALPPGVTPAPQPPAATPPAATATSPAATAPATTEAPTTPPTTTPTATSPSAKTQTATTESGAK